MYSNSLGREFPDTQIYCRIPMKKHHEIPGAIDKRELLIIGSTHSLVKLQEEDMNVKVRSEVIKPSKKVRNLGAIFDDQMSLEEQVSAITRKAYFHLRRIKQTRNNLNHDACAKLIHAKVTSTLDFANGLLIGCSNKLIRRLQLVHADQCSTPSHAQKPTRAYMSPVLRNLHWLPVEKRIHFKTLIFIHGVVHRSDNSPTYLQDSITIYQPRSTHPPIIRRCTLTLALPRTHRIS